MAERSSAQFLSFPAKKRAGLAGRPVANTSESRGRKWKRYVPRGAARVMFRKLRLIEVGKPLLVEFGPLVDISIGGLSLNYVESANRSFDSEDLAIATAENEVVVDPIPFRVVLDRPISQMPDGRIIRQRSVEFGKLNDYQLFQLKKFIDAFGEEKKSRPPSGNVDRRS